MDSEGIGFSRKESLVDSAMPLEYRYSTKLAGLLAGGVILLVGIILFATGPVVPVLSIPALLGIVTALFGLIADPRGFTHSVGKYLVVTDRTIQEVDERGQVLWQVEPGDIAAVRVISRRPVFPWGGSNRWYAEVWRLELHSGPVVRIPVWLLPDRGRRFKRRFEVFRKGILKAGPAVRVRHSQEPK